MRVGFLKWFLVIVFPLLVSCGGGGGRAPQPQPPGGGGTSKPTQIVAIRAESGNVYVLGKPGSTKAGTEVTVSSSSGTVDAISESDGSFTVALGDKPLGSILVSFTDDTGRKKNFRPTIYSYDQQVALDALKVGRAPNDMVFTDAHFIVANSMDNSVQIYSREGFELLKEVQLPEFSSPSYLAVSGSTLFVVCNGNNTLYAIQLSEGEEFGQTIYSVELPSGEAEFLGPGKPAIENGRVFIPVANIDRFVDPGLETPYLPAEVLVVSESTRKLERRITLSGENALEAVTLSPGKVLVVEAGGISFREDYTPFLTSSSFIEVIDAEDFSIEQVVNLGMIGANSPSIDDGRGRLYLGSMVFGWVFVVDTNTFEILRGFLDPIVLTNEFTFVADTLVYQGSLIASSFNEDKIYAVDLESLEPGSYPFPEPIFVGVNEEGFLAGVQNLYADAEKPELYFLQAVANRLGKVNLP